MPAINWSGSRANLDRRDTSTSIQELQDPVPNSSNSAKFTSISSLSIKASSESIAKRRITVNQPQKPPFCDDKQRPLQFFHNNKISTSKYTLLTFIPKNLYEQFRGIANFYFLSLVILQIFPAFATVSIFVTAAPILLIVLVTAIKDAFEDYRRHRSDISVNQTYTYILNNWSNQNYVGPVASQARFIPSKFTQLITKIKLNLGFNTTDFSLQKSPEIINESEYLENSKNINCDPSFNWRRCQWQHVKVGDFIFLRNNDQIPADMIIISTSEQENICFVETKNLDGETNLKIKTGISELQHIKSPKQCVNAKFIIDSELPNVNLYNYNAILIAKPQNSPQLVIPIGANGILLRGCCIRNTSWVIGIAVYTGRDTKILLNAGDTPTKRSRIDRQINPQVTINFVILIGMCLVNGLVSSIYELSFLNENNSVIGIRPEDSDSPYATAFLSFFRSMINFQNIIPIALYISIDIAKTLQSYLIYSDIEMYDEESNSTVICQAWKLCDDLGQVEYIFSDKTGTLTSNTMELRKVSINGVLYGTMYPNSLESKDRMTDEKIMRMGLSKLCDPCFSSENYAFIDTILHQHIIDGTSQGSRIREFFTLLAVCHTVLVEVPDPDNPKKIIYKAQSPDEAALVTSAKDVGFAFLSRVNETVTVSILGQTRNYEILNVLEFNSDRKRMSIIMKRPEGEIVLMCKGADSVIWERLNPETDPILKDTTNIHLSEFANDGLRTLCLAYRVIPQNEYDEWLVKYEKAQRAIIDRDKHVDMAAELIEKKLTLMGCTAIEDKLQEGVPESIEKLAKAGIKIWVLTGDKMETAINIGFSCNLLKKTMTLIVIQADTIENTEKQLIEALTRFWNKDGSPKQDGSFGLVIDGESLKFALETSVKGLTLELGCRCKAVICCRVSPLQKAKVVQLVRKGLGAVCLAIGDGSNDVSMIQEADIGIGISGKEGLQAVMASDYAIAQFRFLSRLLLVHGRWSYIRTSELVLNYFYKNVVWLFIIFWYQFDCGFTTSVIADFSYGIFLNTLFSALPTLLLGIIDRDVSGKLSILVPQLYHKGIQQKLYNSERFWLYILDGIYQSLVCYYVMYLTFSDSTMDKDGNENSKDAMGTFVAYSSILTLNLYALMCSLSWNVITLVCYVLTLSIFIIYAISYSFDPTSFTYGVTSTFYKNPNWYLGIFFSIILCLLPRFTFKFFQQYLYPSDTDILMEIEKYNIYSELKNSIPEIDQDFNDTDHEGVITEELDKEADSVPSLLSNSGRSGRRSSVSNRSRSEERLSRKEKGSRRARSAGHRNVLGESVSERRPISDGFGLDELEISPQSVGEPNITRIPIAKDSGQAEKGILSKLSISSRSRMSSVSSIIKDNLQKASRFVLRLRGKQIERAGRSSSIVYMGDQGKEKSNTGYAFSQDVGMSSAINKSPTRMPDILDQLFDEASPDVLVLSSKNEYIKKPSGLKNEMELNRVSEAEIIDDDINELENSNVVNEKISDRLDITLEKKDQEDSSEKDALDPQNAIIQKNEFIPSADLFVSWYCCGPTVYDKSHMGHARAYITFDILRRIMEDYLGYHVQYVMNITDIDDKIIREARYKYLFEKYKSNITTTDANLIIYLKNTWKSYVDSKLDPFYHGASSNWFDFLKAVEENNIKGACDEAKFELYVKTAKKTLTAIEILSKDHTQNPESTLDECKDIISPYLDSREGHTVSNQKIFRDFSEYWENDYFQDMDALNIKRPSVLTRVSEYVPEISDFVSKIIENGYAYEVDGSVYFDTVKFDKSPDHDYAKLEPWSAGNMKLLQEGEGDLSKDLKGKKNASDFALWKKSKPGEPEWPSPWGPGRPGWHIECSAMAGDVIGKTLDIHSGGIDLAFPHHDNEIAQCEGYFNCNQWVNYFLHAGHLHIEGQKMSKSLKNFVTIKDALNNYTAAQIRIFFLLHPWDSILDYSISAMSEAKTVEGSINNFLSTVKAVVREQTGKYEFTGNHNFKDKEKELTGVFKEKQKLVRNALCDSFNTPVAMTEIRNLITSSNLYYQDCQKSKKLLNSDLLSQIGSYVTRMLRIFGVYVDQNPAVGTVISGAKETNEDSIFPFANALSVFRDQVRQLAQTKADPKEFLKLCDKIRDEDMIELGVLVEDRDDGKALVKLVDKESLLQSREEKRLREIQKQNEKLAKKKEAEIKMLERLAKGSIDPKEMFKTGEYLLEFSAWDEEGMPTLDKQGEVIGKSKRKKIEKEYLAQVKLHAEYLKSKC